MAVESGRSWMLQRRPEEMTLAPSLEKIWQKTMVMLALHLRILHTLQTVSSQ